MKAVKDGVGVSVIGILAGASSMPMLGRLVTRVVRVQGVPAGSRRSFEDMVRAIETQRLEPACEVGASKMEEAPRVIASIAKGAHFGKNCMEFERA